MLGFNGGRLGPQNSMSSYPLSASGVFSLNEVALQKGITGNIVTSNLVLNLDAGNSLSYPGTGTTWTDLSSSGNNATLVNGAGFSSADGGAITFDGTNDTVLLPSSTSFQAEGGNWAWECWFYVDSGASGYHYLLGLGYSHQITWNNDSIEAYFNDFDSASSYNVQNLNSGTNSALAGQWLQCVVTRNGSDWTIYINGIQKNSVSPTSFTVANATDLTIGGFTSTSYTLDGRISIVRIYKGKGLTAAEVTQNFNAVKGRYGL